MVGGPVFLYGVCIAHTQNALAYHLNCQICCADNDEAFIYAARFVCGASVVERKSCTNRKSMRNGRTFTDSEPLCPSQVREHLESGVAFHAADLTASRSDRSLKARQLLPVDVTNLASRMVCHEELWR